MLKKGVSAGVYRDILGVNLCLSKVHCPALAELSVLDAVSIKQSKCRSKIQVGEEREQSKHPARHLPAL